MIVVVTGAVYSGRTTMARAVLDNVEESIQVPIVTTRSRRFLDKEKLSYVQVSEDEFSAMEKDGEFIGVSEYGTDRYGIRKSDIPNKPHDDKVYVVMCDAATATVLGRYLREIDTPGICVYMHCSVRAMLFRMAIMNDSNGIDDHDLIQDIYGDHAIKYSNLHAEADAKEGFIRVIPVNSDSMSYRSYPANVVDPVISILRTYNFHMPTVK